jgi:hypothetical protein
MVYHGFNILDPLNYYPEIPVKHIRLWDCGVTWKDINPSPGVFDYSRLDSIINKARDNNIKSFTLVLGMTPQWAARNPNQGHYAPWIGPGSNSLPFDMAHWEEYVSNTVKRYKGIIRYYQIWNEPQLAEFLYPITDMNALAEMTRRAYRIIKEIDPWSRVVAAPILPRPKSGGIKRGSRYLYALKSKGWPVDIYTCHVYPETGRGPKRFKTLLKRVQDQLEYMNAPKKPLWITETNYNLLAGPLKTKRMVRSYLRKTNLICNELGIGRIYWYAYGIHSNPNVFGIIFNARSVGTEYLKRLL